MKNNTSFFILFLVLITSVDVHSQVNFPSFIADGMVLQRESEVPIWGTSTPNKTINISCSWNDVKYVTTSDDAGKWKLKITTPVAGGPYVIYVNDQIIKNILIGEVWICSGQSNMQWALENSENGKEEAATADFPNIRLFYVARQLARSPQDDLYGRWEETTPKSAASFSAAAYYFGKKLHKELGVPIGLIHTSWGGSSAQAWVQEEILKADSDYDCYYEREKRMELSAKPGISPPNQSTSSLLYNAMIHPLLTYGIRGAIWYQGETNVNLCPDDGIRYEKLFPTLIENWRTEWKQGDFPFYYVQIGPYNYPVTGSAMLRDAQRKSLYVNNTGMVVTLDIGNPNDIHSTNKKDIGNRLAGLALAKDYGQSGLVYSGPLYKSLTIKKHKAIISFSNIGSGLLIKDKQLKAFEIAGSDQKFFPANAKIVGETLVVWSDKVKKPVAVRYAFYNTSKASLFNKEGLPAPSFRTDDWLVRIVPIEK